LAWLRLMLGRALAILRQGFAHIYDVFEPALLVPPDKTLIRAGIDQFTLSARHYANPKLDQASNEQASCWFR
jgi:hypothetical protein